jgi:hypothetical protein
MLRGLAGKFVIKPIKAEIGKSAGNTSEKKLFCCT